MLRKSKYSNFIIHTSQRTSSWNQPTTRSQYQTLVRTGIPYNLLYFYAPWSQWCYVVRPPRRTTAAMCFRRVGWRVSICVTSTPLLCRCSRSHETHQSLCRWGCFFSWSVHPRSLGHQSILMGGGLHSFIIIPILCSWTLGSSRRWGTREEHWEPH